MHKEYSLPIDAAEELIEGEKPFLFPNEKTCQTTLIRLGLILGAGFTRDLATQAFISRIALVGMDPEDRLQTDTMVIYEITKKRMKKVFGRDKN